MKLNPSQPTVAEYCGKMINKEIVVNRDYQRSNQVWPPAAKSFLIETMLLGFPMPKLALHQRTSLKTRKTVSEIIDGQQRSQAILQFYNDEFRLSTKLSLKEARGKKYSTLPEDLQGAFINYGIPVDVFVAATDDQIREMFRRVNSYNVPLNNEEQRHAKFQGPFKWFINETSSSYDSNLIDLGIFTQRQVFRMADAKLFTEVALAIEKGIRTSSPKDLDDLYEDHDKNFPEEDSYRDRIRDLMEFLISLPEIHGTPLMKSAQAYSLLLAITHFQDPVGPLTGFSSPKKRVSSRSRLIERLSELAEIAEQGEDYEGIADDDKDEDAAPDPAWNVDLTDLATFAKASASGTNTITKRAIRFRFFYDALTA